MARKLNRARPRRTSIGELRAPIRLPVKDANALVDLAAIDDDGRELFLEELSHTLAEYRLAKHEIDRNKYREAGPELRRLLAATQAFTEVLEIGTAAFSLLWEQHVDLSDREHNRWLEQIKATCASSLRQAKLGGRPTAFAQKITIIRLACLHARHRALLAHRVPHSFTGDAAIDRRGEFASDTKNTRVDFVRHALRCIEVVATRRTIKDAISIGESEGSLESPERYYDQKAALFESYVAKARADARRRRTT